MKRIAKTITAAIVVAQLILPPTVNAIGIGTKLAGIDIDYLDRLATLTYCGSPWGFRCIANMGNLFTFSDHMISTSAATFSIRLGKVAGQVHSQSLDLAWYPIIIGVNVIEANGSGPVHEVPNLRTDFHIHGIEIRNNIDLSLGPLGHKNWTIGIGDSLPTRLHYTLTSPDLNGFTVSNTKQEPAYEFVYGVYWHNDDSSLAWGAQGIVSKDNVVTHTLNPDNAQPTTLYQTTNIIQWRTGATMTGDRMLPNDASDFLKHWAHDWHFGTDVAFADYDVAGEPNYKHGAAYFSFDGIALPDSLNRYHDNIRGGIRGGVGTDESWGGGVYMLLFHDAVSVDVGCAADHSFICGVGIAAGLPF